MRYLFLYLIVMVNCFFARATVQKKDSLQQYFIIAKQKLSMNREKEAIPYLVYLIQRTTNSYNLKYLLAAAYVESNVVNPKSIELLQGVRRHISMEYNPNSLDEKNVPIYLYYYLSLAFAQNGMCDSAIAQREEFGNKYPFEDQYYLDETKRGIDSCLLRKGKVLIDTLPSYANFIPSYEESKDLNPIKQIVKDSATTDILTKEINYSTRSPLYGIQLGAFEEAVPKQRYPGIKNVITFIDNSGMLRYVIGHFSIKSQAESLLDLLQQKGFQEAFIVNVNNDSIFKNMVVSVNDQNIQSKRYGKVVFSIQLGAFKGEIPPAIAALYLKIEGIIEDQVDNLTIIRVGNYNTFEEAIGNIEQIKAAGIEDAFIIALNNGKRLPLEEAIKLKKVKK